MNKVLIIGCPGSGKSYFSRHLHNATGLPLFHMDMLYWHADKTHLEDDELTEKLRQILSTDQWIIDGNYNNTLELRMSHADTVCFFDLPVGDCVAGITQRIGQQRSDMPWVEEELDPEFLEFVTCFGETSKPRILELLQKYPHQTVHRFTTRQESEAFIGDLS